jgi:hypothetical protein
MKSRKRKFVTGNPSVSTVWVFDHYIVEKEPNAELDAKPEVVFWYWDQKFSGLHEVPNVIEELFSSLDALKDLFKIKEL